MHLYTSLPHVHMSLTQLFCAEAARAAYKTGTVRCMTSLPLWRARALLEEKTGAFGKARALLEQARLKNPAKDVLWLAAVHSEQRAGNPKAAESLIAKGLQVSTAILGWG